MVLCIWRYYMRLSGNIFPNKRKYKYYVQLTPPPPVDTNLLSCYVKKNIPKYSPDLLIYIATL